MVLEIQFQSVNCKTSRIASGVQGESSNVLNLNFTLILHSTQQNIIFNTITSHIAIIYQKWVEGSLT